MIPIEEELTRAIKSRLEQVANEELEDCQKRIRSRMGEYVSGTIINLMEYVSIRTNGLELVVTIEMPKEKTNGQSKA